MEERAITKGFLGKELLEKVSYILISVVMFLIPIFFIPVSFISTQFGTSLIFAFGVICTVILYVVLSLVSGSFEFPKPMKLMVGVFCVIPVVYVLAGIANGFTKMTFLGYTFDIGTAGFIFISFVFMFLVSVLFKTKVRILNSYFAFVISSIILFLFVLSRIIFGVTFLSFGIFKDLTSTMVGSWNNIGIFFGITLLLSLLTLETLRVSKIIKILLSFAIILSLFLLVVVNFSAIWIIIAICSVLLIVYSFFSKPLHTPAVTLKQKISRIPLYPAIVLVISVIFIVWGTSVGGFLANKMHISNVEVRPSLSVTFDIVKNTWKTRPLFGSGPNTFVSQWLSYKPDSITATDFWDTNFAYGIGLIPTFAVTTGLVGILSWLLFFGLFVYFGIKAIFTKFEDLHIKYLVTSSFFISLYLWIMAWIYVPSVVIFTLTFFFTGLFFASLYVSGIVTLTLHTFSYNPRVGFLSSLTLVALFVGLCALGYGLFKNSQSLWYFQKSSYALNTVGDVLLSETYMNKAISAMPYDVYYRALSEIELFKINKIVSQDPKQVKIEDIQKQFKDVLPLAINAGLSATNADDSNYLNWISLGRVYETVVPLKIQGAYESAQTAYGEALRRNPKNPTILAMFARLAVANNDLKSARNYILQAIQTKRNYVDAYFLLSQIEVADNNLKGAIDSVTAASVINPSDPNIFFQLGLLKYNNKDIPGAIEALEKAVSLSPQYANAKYFLGLSYEQAGQHEKAIQQFVDLKATNPDSAEVTAILSNLQAGKSLFSNVSNKVPEKSSKLPVKQ
ncbi:MAG: tetratricopeptide repeat protein [bacterium]